MKINDLVKYKNRIAIIRDHYGVSKCYDLQREGNYNAKLIDDHIDMKELRPYKGRAKLIALKERYGICLNCGKKKLVINFVPLATDENGIPNSNMADEKPYYHKGKFIRCGRCANYGRNSCELHADDILVRYAKCRCFN